MMKIKKRLFIFISLFFLFLAACTNDGDKVNQITTEQLNTMKGEFNSEISRLENEINDRDKRIEDLEKSVEWNNPQY
jgi:peptidoglycan hydrolase CwlO-like protein